MTVKNSQPPSGGCVLKPALVVVIVNRLIQPPSGGCVLKRFGPGSNLMRDASRLRAAVC